MHPVQSYKQQSVDGPASRSSATNINHEFIVGVDNYTGPSAANNEVPTGAKVGNVQILLCFSNLVAISALLHLTIQLLHTGQSQVEPGAVGGSSQRNQVFHTAMRFMGKEQNTNWIIPFKIPPKFQRIREGDKWRIVYRADAVFASATQVIYKFYR